MNSSEWSAYEKLVMAKLAQLDSDITALDEKVTLLRIDVAQLKVKSALWGGLAGLVPVVIGVVAVFTGATP